MARRFDVGRHARELETQILKFGDRPAELPALLRIGQRILQRALRQPDGSRGGMCTRFIQAFGQGIESPAFLADQGVRRYAEAIKRQFPGFPTEIADLGNFTAVDPLRERTPLLVDDESADAEVPLVFVRPR